MNKTIPMMMMVLLMMMMVMSDGSEEAQSFSRFINEDAVLKRLEVIRKRVAEVQLISKCSANVDYLEIDRCNKSRRGELEEDAVTEGTVLEEGPEGATTEGTELEDAVTEGTVLEDAVTEGSGLEEDAVTEGTVLEEGPEGATTEGTELEDAVTEGTEPEEGPEEATTEGTLLEEGPEEATTEGTELEEGPEGATTEGTELEEGPEGATTEGMEPEDAVTEGTELEEGPEGATTEQPEGVTTEGMEPEDAVTEGTELEEGATTEQPEGATTEQPEGATTEQPEGATTEGTESEDDECDYAELRETHTMLLKENKDCQSFFNGFKSDSEKDEILEVHNTLRAKVARGEETRGSPGPQPSAANMREMIWNDELAKVAQAWANQCPVDHDNSFDRTICGNDYFVGQNIHYYYGYEATPNWTRGITEWYDEVKDLPDGFVENFQILQSDVMIGHYTQVVWADTNEIGCGVVHYEYTDENGALYTESKTYVCNYGPAGNVLTLPMYIEGPPASKCTNGVSENYPDLCA